MKSIKILKILWKKGNTSKMGNAIYFKIAGYVDLDMLHIFAICPTMVWRVIPLEMHFLLTFAAFGYSNNQREATLLQNVK
jgi:hypothetical protein